MSDSMQGIAIIGMAGRFPKARNVDEFWKNLCAGVEGISFFSDEELAAGGVVVPKENRNYVKARGVLDDADLFDAAFFGMNPKEAEVTDPQHRVFLECAWEALESAGWDAERFDGAIGVFAGMSMNTYAAHNLASHPELISLIGDYQVMLGNDKDFLPTRVSYKLNLKGPSLNIQTACSTSLVAVCVACQHLLNYQCDMALAGAVSVSFPQKKGHLYREGGIASPDGHCRAFDAQAAGTVAGEGAGIVVLKRLEDALADGDSICAVIKGFAINNDGAAKIGYTAPSVEGQAEVIALAQAMAGVEPETISYVEAHGTGTPLGDPIEIEGLTKAFSAGTSKKNFCAVGSVKSNIGHLDTAAGVAGLIKTTLALQHKLLPPTLHYEAANPKIDFANSPFFVNRKLTEWKNGNGPRRAGVSSFGIGGTNAHVVLEEAPVAQVSKRAVSPTSKSRPSQLILLSAKTATALDRATGNLAAHLKQHPELNLSDVAHTLQVGRREFAHRRMLVSRDTDEAANALVSLDPKRVATRVQANDNPPVVFMFPGQGAQHVNMGLDLYESEQTFREDVDACCELFEPHLGLDLRTILFPNADQEEEATRQLTQTRVTQPALFVIEYALAKLWMSWGVKPEAMIGHSIGEYVAACLAGVFSLEDALKLVAERGRLMQQMPAGTMLAVRLPERDVLPLLTDRLSLATVNGVASCVISGPTDAVEELRSQLAQRNVAATPLQTSHAFHSAMMEPMLGEFTELVQSVNRHAPELPFVSNVTGNWITAEQATDPAYWARQLRHTVRFADGLGELLKVPERVLLEVGPGQTLSNLAKQHPAKNSKTSVVSSLPRANASSSELSSLLTALGELWLCGARVDWRSFHADETRRRVRLPTYPFERKRYWIEPKGRMERTSESNGASNGNGAKQGGEKPLAHHESSVPERGCVEDQPQRIPNGHSAAAGAPTPAQSRSPGQGKARIIEELRALFADLSGLNLDDTASTTTFTELGFESLFLTQASLAIEKKFGVRIAFRQLLEEANSLDGLAGFIESQQNHPASDEPFVPPQGLGLRQSSGALDDARLPNRQRTSPVQDDASLNQPVQGSKDRNLKVNLEDELHRLRRQETQLTQAISVKDMRSYPGLEPGLNELCSAYICDYFRTCGITFDAGCRYGIAEIKSALQLRPAYEKFFRFMLTALEEDGIIRLGEDAVECLRPAEKLPDSSGLHARLLQQHPAFAGLLDMLQHCARHYRAALAGDILGVSVLLPDGRHDFLKARLQEYTDQHKNVRRYESVAKQLVLNLSRKTPLRILEVGGGGGDLTWQLVPELAGRGCEYHFTDIGRSFIEEARKEAARRGLNFMKFGVLDIAKDPALQGFPANSFDVVLGLNVVHATARVDETLAHLRQLLVPGGVIALVELTKNWRWDTMIIGLAVGWWMFDDAFGKSSPLVDLTCWEEEFRAAGFTSVAAVPSDQGERDSTDAGLILAQWQPELAPSTRASNNLGKAASAGSPHSLNGEDGSVALPISSSPSDGGEGGQIGIRSLALTPAQSEVWFASQLGGDASCAYNDSRLLSFRGPLQTAVLHTALQRLVERHEALRTVFSPNGDAQHILPQRTLELPLIDLSHLDAADREKQLAEREANEAGQPFDVVEGPLIRARLVRLAVEQHVLFLTIHHLVCDGHSWGILLRDLAELYSAESRGIPPQLDPPLQFSEFAREHVRRQDGPVGAVAAGFWVGQFSDGAPVLELPTDQTRSSNWTFRGARESRTLDSSLNQALKRLSAAHDCTLFTTLLAAQYVLLQRLTGQDDFVVGIPAADRAMEASQTLVGHCVNFLPVRVRFASKPTFAEFLGQVRQTFFAAYEHRDFTLGTLIQKLNLPRDQSRMPLVSATFNFGRLHGALMFAGLETGHTMNSKSFSSFDLSLSVADEDGVLHLDWRYNTSLFRPETIRRWLGHFQSLLEGIVARPQASMVDLPLLSPEEARQILIEWNDTCTDYPKDQTVAQLFEEQVARTPESVAVEFEGARLTYRELNERANQLAHHLQKRGVGPDILVAVCLERSLDMIVSLLGILKAGGVYLPLDAAHPKERLALMLEDARVPMVLTQDKLRPLLPETDHVQSLDLKREEIGREPLTNPVSQATAESLAYVSFTSGSIGKPKGVCVPHRAVVRLVKNTNYASFAATDVFLQLAPLAFDASTFEIWGPLLNGGRLVIFPPHAPSLVELGEFIQQRGVTTLWLSAGFFHQMIEEQSHALRGVRQLLAGGDVLSVPHVKRALAALPDCRLINGYGPTENTTFTCCHQITSASVEGRSIPIGRPIANTQVYLLDENLRPVPIGVPGELYAGGDGLARGYLNQPELTAEKFIPNPFSRSADSLVRESPSSRGQSCPRSDSMLYKTGDLARWLPDGSIEFLGRLDAQIKIRGNRVELGEIETVLGRHPAVRKCVVAARKDGSGDKQLTAYFVGTDSAQTTVEELREHLRRALPDYMIPARVVRLQSLPLTANGKVDRKALPDPGQSENDSRPPSVPVSDEVEKQLAGIWQDVLGHIRVGASDDFFELGGHSLLALRLIARVETIFGKRIPVASVFHARTVAQMANLLREASQPLRATSVVEIQPQGSRPPLMFVHGAGGGMLWGYTALSQHLGTDQPVYAFKSRGLDGQEEFDTIEEMAAHYVADLRAFQPQGPYYLGGYCFGGNVAFEIARQLLAQGERVALLALLNSIPPNSAYDHAAPTPVWLARFVGNLCYFTGCLLRRPRRERHLFIGWYARTFTRRIARLFGRRLSSGVVVDELVDLTAYPPEQRRLWRTHIHALFRHHTKPYAGRVTLLRSRGHPFWCSFDSAYGWRAFAAGGATIHLVPGAHEQILDEPHVGVLAEKLRGELARAQNEEAKVPTVTDLPSPTIEQPVELVQNGETARPRQIASSIVVIQPHGSKPPLFLVHGIGGGMLWGYANLSRFLGPDQPVYALNSRGLDGHEEFGTIEEMAAQYVAELRAFQPEGDYRLGGYCFGGNVAYEMARLLEAQGQQVSLLAMFNCPLPNSSYYRVRLTPGFCFNYLKNFTSRLRHVARLKPEQRRTLVLWRGRILKKQCLNVFNRFRGVTPELGANDWVDLATQPEDRRELWAIHLHAYNGYQPKPYGGPVTLFRTHDHPLICSFDDTCGWREFVAGGVTVHIVPGEHESTLDVPHVKSVAKILETYLQPTQETQAAKSEQAATTTALSSAGKNQPPLEWNHTQADYPREKCVHHLFEEQVARTPQAVAVVFQNEPMTYAELNQRADEVAERLRALGIGPDVPVGICLERSLEMVIGVLAVLKAGGAYLPLDPAYPTERLNLMIENSRSPLVLTQRELEKKFNSGNSKFELLRIEDLLLPTHTSPNGSRTRTRTKDEDDRTPQSANSKPQSSDLAYIIHTSGSTGTPKGVAMPHRPLVNLIAWQVRNSKLPPGARTLQFASLSFDVSFQEMFSTWCAGGTLVLANENLRRDPVALWRFIRENKIERLFMPFVALQQLAETFKPGVSGDWALREIITAGEQLQTTPALVRMFERLTGCTLHNQYGPSESHVVTAFTLSGPPREWPALPSIGRPIANTQIYLLDEQQQRVVVGVPGELYIGGDCLARGYLHQPELTAGRFIPNPFSDDAEARLYKTGDLARHQPDGNIEFLGRTDHQIKIRGFRIELGEIEATLRQHPKVRDAVVMARADQPGQKRLVAYYISQPEQPRADEELRLFLKAKLPEYMVPTAFVSLEIFPLTPSGKVARNRLPAPDQSRHELPANFAPPGTPTQQALARIWCDVLGLSQIGIHDDFFELGGNSILAVQAIARMSELFGVELPVSGLFEAPTIAQAAKGLPAPPLEKERHETDRQPAMAN